MKTRMDFVEKWAEFVSTHPDSEWSKLQAELIDSQIDNASNVRLSREQVKHIKGR